MENEKNPHEKLIFLAKERIARERERRNKKVNDSRRLFEFAVDDKVLLKSAPISSALNNTIASFFDVYEGPYEAKKKYGNFLIC